MFRKVHKGMVSAYFRLVITYFKHLEHNTITIIKKDYQLYTSINVINFYIENNRYKDMTSLLLLYQYTKKLVFLFDETEVITIKYKIDPVISSIFPNTRFDLLMKYSKFFINLLLLLINFIIFK